LGFVEDNSAFRATGDSSAGRLNLVGIDVLVTHDSGTLVVAIKQLRCDRPAPPVAGALCCGYGQVHRDLSPHLARSMQTIIIDITFLPVKECSII
jgi:hypothetical protein